MCTLAIWIRALPGFPLVVAANRDEWLERPASGPMVLAEHPRRVGGCDLVAGGTWLATSTYGMVAGLLNRRTEGSPDPSRRSRGLLPLLALEAPSARAAEPTIAALDPEAYNPFNLLVADAHDAWVAQNVGGRLAITRLDAGVHVLTNLDVDDPRCPRIARSTRLFAAAGEAFATDRDAPRFRATLGRILADHETALDPRVPAPFGALCVHAGAYGTRCSSLLFLDEEGSFEHWFADGPPCRKPFAPARVPTDD